ncbi:hypothetical protein bthur0008_60350 [Bacillus thuringiensis serovar berliner ATCC 10792]|nr:hypothetical protein bthur0008_60350 [Bacillus thuringiensis serovar berliner ATCC 10792]
MERKSSYKKNLISDQLLNHHFKYIIEFQKYVIEITYFF